MSNKIDKSRDAVVEFFRTANPQDEFFIVTFSEKPELLPTSLRIWKTSRAGWFTPAQGPDFAAGRHLPGHDPHAQGALEKKPCSSSPMVATTIAVTPRAKSGRW